MATRTELVNRRGVLKGNVTRLHTYIQALTPTDPVDELKERLVRVMSSFDEFDTIQTKIDLITVQEEGEVDEEVEKEISQYRLDFEDLYYSVVTSAKNRIKTTEGQAVPSQPAQASQSQVHTQLGTTNQVPVTQKYDLPKMTLPTFNGDYQQWQYFHDLFKSIIHEQTSISGVIKLCHLRASLTGDAAKIIESLSITETNYEVAWKLVCDRYQKKRLLVSQHTRALLRLPTLSKEAHTELRKFVDEARRRVEALRALQEPVDTWDTILIQLLIDKLDKATVREWEMRNNDDTVPTLKELLDSLSHRCGALEAVYPTDSTTQARPNQSSSFNNNKGKQFSKSDRFPASKSQANIAQGNGCYKCGKPHPLYACPEFKALSSTQRIQETHASEICLNCLLKAHPGSECKGSCRVCFQKHNTLLHSEGSSPGRHPTSIPSKSVAHTAAVTALTTQSGYEALLGSAVIIVLDHRGKPHTCRALLDSGSTSNFMTTDLCTRLQLPIKNQDFEIGGIGGTCTQGASLTQATILSRFNEFLTQLNFLVMDKVTNDLPVLTREEQRWIIPPNIKLADPEYHAGGPVDILLGIGIFWELICVGQIKLGRGLPVLQKTKLGWIIAGDLSNISGTRKGVCNLSMSRLENQIEKFWQIEEGFNQQRILSAEEALCEEHFRNNITRSEDGHFTVRLPLREDQHTLGDLFNQAVKRLQGLERRFKGDPQLKASYFSVIQEYQELNHMTEVQTESIDVNKVRYVIPHHAVLKPDSLTTKIRVVFDASAETTSGKSLNDLLLVGPTIQQGLLSLVLRFRLHKYVFTADIEKMYRQVWVNATDRNLQCVLWRGDPTDPIKIFQLNTVTFGTAAAPFLATRCLKEAANIVKDKYPLAARVIANDFYVDDMLTGADNLQAAWNIRKQVTSSLKEVGFNLRKWCSNSPELMGEQNHNSSTSSQMVEFGNQEESKTLGIRWHPSTDHLQYNINIDVKFRKVSKRTILSETAQIFDPLGLLAPAIIPAKILMQQLWELKLGWDEAVPQDVYTQWIRYREELKSLNEIQIPRRVIEGENFDLQLHGFADSSERAYGACIFLRATDPSGVISVRLLCARSRVAPLKQHSLPNLELCAALLLAELTQTVKESLQLADLHDTFWTDSEIVLAWLAKEPRNWITFIANRVSKMQQLTDVSHWRHVPTETNPADLVSRELPPKELIENSLWWTGPPWLQWEPRNWPRDGQTPEEVPEQRKQVICHLSVSTQHICHNYSTLRDLLQATISLFRIYQIITGINQEGFKEPASTHERHQALAALIKISQCEEFTPEIRGLERKASLGSKNRLLGLNPFIDQDGLLRVGGRLDNSDRPEDQRHPVILAPYHRLTKLIIIAEHERLLHAGPQSVLANLRLRYWIVRGRNAVKEVIRKCNSCARVNPISITPQMGHLPADRTKKARPFLNSGVDYAGPISMKTGTRRSQTTTKGYIAIFVCFCTKAIHLELVTSLTTAAFLSALKRFIARRGKVATLYSDNGTNFVGAAKELQGLQETLQAAELKEHLSADGIKWQFIPPRSPHFGGLWEAGVRSVKHHLRRVLGDSLFTFEEYYTVLTQIEACLNSRPITYLSDDPADPLPLTPGHFLIGEPMEAPFEEDVTEIPSNRLNVWEHLQKIKQHFWKRWHVEYLSSLQERTKWRRNSTDLLQIDDVVLLKDENLPPLKWVVGKVSTLHPGKDGVIRVATVTTSSGDFKRALTKLCVLPRKDEIV